MTNAHAAEQIADNIVALVNSRVQSPTKAEIVNIVLSGAAASPMPVAASTDVRLRELIPLLRAAELEACALDTRRGPKFDAAEAVVEGLKADCYTTLGAETQPRCLGRHRDAGGHCALLVGRDRRRPEAPAKASTMSSGV